MKILIIHHFGGVGGGTNSCLDIASILKKLGHEVEIGISDPSIDVQQQINALGISFNKELPPIISINYHSANRNIVKSWIRYIKSRSYRQQWEKYISEQNPDIIILNSMIQSPIVHIVSQMKCKCICFVRETKYWGQLSPLNRMIKSALNKADSVVFLTRYDQESWSLSANVHTYVVPDIVDSSRFSISKEKCSVLLEMRAQYSWDTAVLYLGGYSYAKGALDLLKATAIALDAGCNIGVFLLGDSYKRFDEERGLRRVFHRTQRKYVEDCVEIVNKLNSNKTHAVEIGLTTNVAEWYYMSDIVVFPVKEIHQARPAYEAGFFGLPIIAPNYPHLKEAIKDKYNGILYSKDKVSALAEAMIELDRNKDFSKNLGENNYLETEKSHTIEVAEKLIRRIIESL